MTPTFFIVVWLSLGNPSATFQQIDIPIGMSEERCAVFGHFYAERDARVRALEREGWREEGWKCQKVGLPL